jgi:hypothetical protein
MKNMVIKSKTGKCWLIASIFGIFFVILGILLYYPRISDSYYPSNYSHVFEYSPFISFFALFVFVPSLIQFIIVKKGYHNLSKKLIYIGGIFLGIFLFILLILIFATIHELKNFKIEIILILIILGVITTYLFFKVSQIHKHRDNQQKTETKNKSVETVNLIKNIESTDSNKDILQNYKVVPSGVSYTEVTKKMKQLESFKDTIFLDDIKTLILDEKNEEAYTLICQREDAYEKFLARQKDLKYVEEKIRNLTKRIANGEISSETFNRARDDLEREKKEIEEQLWTLRLKLFKEDYEKPF